MTMHLLRPPAPVTARVSTSVSVEGLLLLGDSRLPVGAHACGATALEAVAGGRVRSLDGLVDHLQGRLFTAGLTAAVCAVAARSLAAGSSPVPAALGALGAAWGVLDGAMDARLPGEGGARASSRAQGRAVVRFGRTCWPHDCWDLLGPAPHHAVALGVAAAACGGSSRDAALLCAQAGIAGPAQQAVAALGLPSGAVAAVLARLVPSVDAVAARAVDLAGRLATFRSLPVGPMLDVAPGLRPLD